MAQGRSHHALFEKMWREEAKYRCRDCKRVFRLRVPPYMGSAPPEQLFGNDCEGPPMEQKEHRLYLIDEGEGFRQHRCSKCHKVFNERYNRERMTWPVDPAEGDTCRGELPFPPDNALVEGMKLHMRPRLDKGEGMMLARVVVEIYSHEVLVAEQTILSGVVEEVEEFFNGRMTLKEVYKAWEWL